MSPASINGPRVYVACLASYNSGRLHGAWVDATSAESIHEGIAQVIATSPTEGAEEWAFHDYDGFMGLKLGESEDPEKIAELAAFLEEHGEEGKAYIEMAGQDYWTPEGFQDAFQGTYESVEDYAAEMLEDTGAFDGAPEVLKNYFDYEAYARDLVFGGDITAVEVGYKRVHIFSNH